MGGLRRCIKSTSSKSLISYVLSSSAKQKTPESSPVSLTCFKTHSRPLFLFSTPLGQESAGFILNLGGIGAESIKSGVSLGGITKVYTVSYDALLSTLRRQVAVFIWIRFHFRAFLQERVECVCVGSNFSWGLALIFHRKNLVISSSNLSDLQSVENEM